MSPLDPFEARRAHLISLHTAGGWDLVARWTMDRLAAAVEALRTARGIISDLRESEFDSCTVCGNPETMDAYEARIISGYDAALALIDAALPEPPKEPT